MLESGLFQKCTEKASRLLVGAGDTTLAKKEDRVIITLACGNCKRRNYTTMKNKKNDPDRLNIKKYCRYCRAHQEHKETKR